METSKAEGAVQEVAGKVESAVGDVTGDGVPDLIGIAGGDAGKALIVYPQCGSRDLAGLGKGGK